jgi:hypothetical protein
MNESIGPTQKPPLAMHTHTHTHTHTHIHTRTQCPWLSHLLIVLLADQHFLKVELSFEERVYHFWARMQTHKIDCVRSNSKSAFCAVMQDLMSTSFSYSFVLSC